MNGSRASRSEREERVMALLAAARRLADPRDPLGIEARRRLPEATGLSAAGVELGLTRHLQRETSSENMSRLIERAGDAPRVHVVLSANVFVGALRAMALAVAAAPAVRVRASTREAIMAPLLCRALVEAGADLEIEMVEHIAPREGDEVHVYGRAETIEAIRARWGSGVKIRGHGPGFGIALVDATRDDGVDAATLLSWDVVAFDQRGCLSPRVVFVRGAPAEVESFAAQVAHQLGERQNDVPRGPLSEEEERGQSLYRLTLQTVGRCIAGNTFTVGLDPSPRALTLPPTGRNLHVVQVSGAEIPAFLLEPFSGAITCVGHVPTHSFSERAPRLSPGLARGARLSPLGLMQSPPLDGPVDLRGVV